MSLVCNLRNVMIKSSKKVYEELFQVVIANMLGEHREMEPLLSIPNRTVKRFIADDSVGLLM